MSLAFDEYDLVASICKESFFSFLKEFWSTIIPEKFICNWHIKYICDEIQIAAERVFRGEEKKYDLIINVPPGSTKSIMCSEMFPGWVWTRMPTAGFIGASYTHDLAIDLSRRNRNLVKSEKYQGCFPYVRISSDMDAKGHFANTRKGERNSVGVGGDVTGRHGDFILADDPLNPKGARSEAELSASNQFMTETLWSRKKDKSVTVMVLIQQRLCQNDTTGMMMELANRGEIKVKHICLPAVLTDDIKPFECRAYYEDGLLDPKRLPKKVLDEALGTLGEYAYAGQYLQRPIPLGGGQFKAERIHIVKYTESSVPRKWIKRVRYWDKAGTAGGGAFTVGALLGKDKEQRFWILHMKRGQWDTAERESIIKDIAKQDGKDVVVGIEQEPGSSGKDSARWTVKNLAGWRVSIDRPTGSKELRSDPFSTQVNAGNVYMIEADWNRLCLDEMSFFPFSHYKDQVDALSGAFKELTVPFRVGVFGR